jgi:hypothetical protein
MAQPITIEEDRNFIGFMRKMSRSDAHHDFKEKLNDQDFQVYNDSLPNTNPVFPNVDGSHPGEDIILRSIGIQAFSKAYPYTPQAPPNFTAIDIGYPINAGQSIKLHTYSYIYIPNDKFNAAIVGPIIQNNSLFIMDTPPIKDFFDRIQGNVVGAGQQLNNLYFLSTPETVSDPAGKTNPFNPQFKKTTQNNFYSVVEVNPNPPIIYQNYNPTYFNNNTNQLFFSNFQYSFSNLILKKNGTKAKKAQYEGESSIIDSAGVEIRRVKTGPSEKNTAIEKLVIFFKELLKIKKKTPLEYNKQKNCGIQQKRAGDWLQVLCSKLLMTGTRNYIDVNTGLAISLGNNIAQGGTKNPVYFTTQDRICLAYALLMGLDNILFMDGQKEGVFFFKKNDSCSTIGGLQCQPQPIVQGGGMTGGVYENEQEDSSQDPSQDPSQYTLEEAISIIQTYPDEILEWNAYNNILILCNKLNDYSFLMDYSEKMRIVLDNPAQNFICRLIVNILIHKENDESYSYYEEEMNLIIENINSNPDYKFRFVNFINYLITILHTKLEKSKFTPTYINTELEEKIKSFSDISSEEADATFETSLNLFSDNDDIIRNVVCPILLDIYCMCEFIADCNNIQFIISNYLIQIEYCFNDANEEKNNELLFIQNWLKNFITIHEGSVIAIEHFKNYFKIIIEGFSEKIDGGSSASTRTREPHRINSIKKPFKLSISGLSGKNSKGSLGRPQSIVRNIKRIKPPQMNIKTIEEEEEPVHDTDIHNRISKNMLDLFGRTELTTNNPQNIEMFELFINQIPPEQLQVQATTDEIEILAETDEQQQEKDSIIQQQQQQQDYNKSLLLINITDIMRAITVNEFKRLEYLGQGQGGSNRKKSHKKKYKKKANKKTRRNSKKTKKNKTNKNKRVKRKKYTR